MKFTHAHKREIIDNGFVKVSGVIPPAMVRDAMRAINHSLGEEGMNKEDLPRMRSQSYCPEVMGTPPISDLFNKTPAFSLAESAIGEGQINPVGGGQIALRFPTMADPPRPPRPHLDGMYSPMNGVPEGTIQNFTMLVGVFLSEVPHDYCGNFTVWPGTHTIYEKHFRERGPESLLEGMPKVEIPPPVQLTAQPGDVVFCHYQVAHGAAVNTSPYPRYAIFFRLSRPGHGDRKLEVMKDIWMEWDGIREVLNEEQG